MASVIKQAVAAATSSSSSSSSSTKKANVDSDGNDKTKNFRLRITAGPDYDKSLQRLVVVNSSEGHQVSEHVAISLRIRDYSGLPSASPSSVPEYFDLPQHSKDTFSVAFAITPPKDIPAADLYFGIDTGHNPVRKFGIPKSLVHTAFRIVKEFIDPSLSCDAGVDEPWVRGPVVAGATTSFCVGDRVEVAGESTGKPAAPNEGGTEQLSQDSPSSPPPKLPSRVASPSRRSSSVASGPPQDLSAHTFPSPHLLVEGATSSEAAAHRKAQGLPSDPSKRRKHLNSASNRSKFVLQKGRTYYFDFANGYIDWKEYALKLPGFSVPVLKYLGGGKSPSVSATSPRPESEVGDEADTNEGHPAEGGAAAAKGGSGSHKVRFFLKDVATGEMYFVIMCTLLTGEDLRLALAEDQQADQTGPS